MSATTTGSKIPKQILERLQDAQKESGFLSAEVMTEVADALGVSKSDVYGVSTFYSFLSTQPLGRNIIRVCQSLPCHFENGHAIIESITKELGIKAGETTADGRFSFTLTNCIGACDKAPAMLINNDVHGDLTPAKIPGILKTYK